MAHCPPEKLADIEDVLQALRALPGLTEKKPGIFYIRADGFLHFHIKDGHRWAHVKTGRRGGWDELPLPFDADAAARKDFLAAVRRHQQAFMRPRV